MPCVMSWALTVGEHWLTLYEKMLVFRHGEMMAVGKKKKFQFRYDVCSAKKNIIKTYCQYM